MVREKPLRVVRIPSNFGKRLGHVCVGRESAAGLWKRFISRGVRFEKKMVKLHK